MILVLYTFLTQSVDIDRHMLIEALQVSDCSALALMSYSKAWIALENLLDSMYKYRPLSAAGQLYSHTCHLADTRRTSRHHDVCTAAEHDSCRSLHCCLNKRRLIEFCNLRSRLEYV